MKQEEIETMLRKDKNNLNMAFHERRLILLAVIKAKYKLEKAYDFNAPSTMTFDSYTRKFYRYGFQLKNLKIAVEKIKKEERKLKRNENKNRKSTDRQ